jgi:hypothetical protein
VRKVCSIRNALDRRVQKAVYGDEPVTDAQREALRNIRTGNYSAVRLLALIGETDSGTKAEPFKGFVKLSRPIAASKLSLAFARIIEATCSSTPGLASAALTFFGQLLKKLVSVIEEDTDWHEISTYYISIIRKASHPAAEYSFGEGTQAHASLDTDWIHQNTEAYEKLCINTQQKRAEKSAIVAFAAFKRGNSGGGGGDGGIGGGGGGGGGKQKKKKSNSGGGDKGGGGGGGADFIAKATTNGGGGGKAAKKVTVSDAARSPDAAQGDPVPLPKTAEGRVDAAALKDWMGEFGLNVVEGKQPCWNYWHSQGCSRQPCSFHHTEP